MQSKLNYPIEGDPLLAFHFFGLAHCLHKYWFATFIANAVRCGVCGAWSKAEKACPMLLARASWPLTRGYSPLAPDDATLSACFDCTASSTRFQPQTAWPTHVTEQWSRVGGRTRQGSCLVAGMPRLERVPESELDGKRTWAAWVQCIIFALGKCRAMKTVNNLKQKTKSPGQNPNGCAAGLAANYACQK